MRVKIDIEGADKIIEQLQRMAVDTVQRHLRESGMAGAEVIRQDAGTRVNTGPHAKHLKDALVVEEVRERDSRVDFAIGPDRDHWYGRLVEKGHAIVRVSGRIKKNGRTIRRILEVKGNVPAHPFLRPAIDNTRAEAQAVMTAELKRRLGL